MTKDSNMRKTFECNNSMIITIPIRNLRGGEGQMEPESFTCVFKDSYKVFVHKGKPKHVGAVQALIGVFICSLGALCDFSDTVFVLPCIVFVITGLLSYASGKTPRMSLAKLSFSLNIISFFWSICAFSLNLVSFFFGPLYYPWDAWIPILILILLVSENFMALFLIYWTSKAVCRQEFNTLPVILLKSE